MGKKTGKAIDKLLLPKWRVTIASVHDFGGQDIFVPPVVAKGWTPKVT